jgi:hypothetical protein
MARLPTRYRRWLPAALALVALAVVLFIVEARRPVNRAGRVRIGMTTNELESLFGPPHRVQPWWRDGSPCFLWDFEDGSHLWVYMDEKDRVRSKEFRPGPSSEWRRRLRGLGFPL